MPLTMQRVQALLGATIAAMLLVAVGVGVVPRLGHATPRAAGTVANTGDTGTSATPASSELPPPELATATAADPTPTGAAPSMATPITTTAPATAPSTGAAAATASAPTTPAPSSLPPGQRVNPTSAQVQAAIGALHQRIPLFAPTDQQLRTFAEAVCASFDQGQTAAQVQSSVQEAVSHIQGASLSSADADFAVRTVVDLRCPGY